MNKQLQAASVAAERARNGRRDESAAAGSSPGATETRYVGVWSGGGGGVSRGRGTVRWSGR